MRAAEAMHFLRSITAEKVALHVTLPTPLVLAGLLFDQVKAAEVPNSKSLCCTRIDFVPGERQYCRSSPYKVRQHEETALKHLLTKH